MLVPRVFELLGIMLKPDTAPEAAGAEGGPGAAAAPPARAARPPMQYDPRTVTALMEMGFDERRVHQVRERRVDLWQQVQRELVPSVLLRAFVCSASLRKCRV